jgi:hypothetical protein
MFKELESAVMAPDIAKVDADRDLNPGLPAWDFSNSVLRMPTEMRVMAIRDAAARETAITHTPEFIRFGVDYRELCGV